MKNIVSKGKRALHVGVVSTTILWSMGFVSIVPAFAADSVTLKDGDLIKATNDAAVYLYSNGTRSPFFNLGLFNSWNYDAKKVIKMQPSDLQKIDLSGSNVTYRPCTRLIKITSDQKTYVVTAGGVLRHLADQDVATALFGSTWNKQIDDVIDILFSSYTKGDPITKAMAIPGCVLKDAATTKTYYINADGTKSELDAAGISANHFAAKFFLTAPKDVDLSKVASGAAISAASADLSMYQPKAAAKAADKPADKAADKPADKPVVIGTGLTITAQPATNTTTMIADTTTAEGAQALGELGQFTFAAGADGDVKVKTLKLTRTSDSISSDTDLSNVYLYANGVRLAEMTSYSNRVVTFTSTSALFTVGKGTSTVLMVKGDLANGTTAAKTFTLSIASEADVVTDGAKPTATFPLLGNKVQTATVADLGRLTINNFATFPANVDPDGQSKELWRFNLVGADQVIAVSKLNLTMVGSANPADITNLYLEVAGTAASKELSVNTDNTLLFDLADKPISLDKGQTKTVLLKGKVIGGTNRTFKFTIRKSADIAAKDTNYNVWLKPNQTDTLTVIEPTANAGTTINTGSLAITKDDTSANGNVALGATNVDLAKFKLVATGEAVKLTSLSISVVGTVAANGIDSGQILFGSDDPKVGYTQLGSTTDLNSATTDDGDVAAGGDDTVYSPGNSLVVTPGTPMYLKVVGAVRHADATAYAGGETLTVKLNAGANGTGQSSSVTINTSAATANLLTIRGGTLTATANLGILNCTVNNPCGVKGASAVRIGSFTLTAGQGEPVTITQMRVTDAVTNKTETNDGNVNVNLDNGAARTITFGTAARVDEFLVGESYYVFETASVAEAATFTVTAKNNTTGVLTGTVSGAAADFPDANQALSLVSASGATDTLADTFQNLRLCKKDSKCAASTDLYGTAVTSLTDTAATAYTFSPSTPAKLTAGAQLTVDVVADVKTNATTLSVNSDGNGIVSFTAATATGDQTSTDASYAGGAVPLQNIYITGSGSFSGATFESNPVATQIVMGTANNDLAVFKLTADPSEDITITQFIATDLSAASGQLQNIKLWKKLDADTAYAQLGSTVNTMSANANGTATFNALSLNVPKNGNVWLKVSADVVGYQGGASNSNTTHQVRLAAAGITANGTGSGTVLANVPAANLDTAVHTAFRSAFTMGLAGTQPAASQSPNDKVLSLMLSDTNGQGRMRAALQANDEAAASWVVTNGAVTASAAVTPVDGTNAILYTPAGGAAAADGFGYDFGAGANLQNYARASFWFRSTAASAANDLQLVTSDGANLTTNTQTFNGFGAAGFAANTWTYVDFQLSTAASPNVATALSATPTSATRVIGVRILNNAATYNGAGGAMRIDNMRLYSSAITISVNGSLNNATRAGSATGNAVTLRDTAGNVKAIGYYNGTSANSGSVIVTVGTDITAGGVGTDFALTSTPTQYDIIADTSQTTGIANNAGAGADNVSFVIDLGGNASTGGVRWTDNAVDFLTPTTFNNRAIAWVLPTATQSSPLVRTIGY